MIKLYPLTRSESKIWFWTLCPKQNCLRDTRYPKTKYSFRRDKEILDLRTPPKHLSCRFLKKRQRLLTLCIGENSLHWKWWEDWLKPAEAEKNWLTSVTENPKGYSDLRLCRVWVPKHYCEGSAPISQLRCPMCGFFFQEDSSHLQTTVATCSSRFTFYQISNSERNRGPFKVDTTELLGQVLVVPALVIRFC